MRQAKHKNSPAPAVSPVAAVEPVQANPANEAATPAQVAAPVAEPATAPVVETPAAAAEKPSAKPARKAKVVRDSFTMPETDYARLGELKRRCLSVGVSAKKSELLRAGLQALSALPAEQLAAAIGALESVKTGRPAHDKPEDSAA
jgi:hypothetical protein